MIALVAPLLANGDSPNTLGGNALGRPDDVIEASGLIGLYRTPSNGLDESIEIRLTAHPDGWYFEERLLSCVGDQLVRSGTWSYDGARIYLESVSELREYVPIGHGESMYLVPAQFTDELGATVDPRRINALMVIGIVERVSEVVSDTNDLSSPNDEWPLISPLILNFPWTYGDDAAVARYEYSEFD